MAEYVWVCLNGKSAKVWGYDMFTPTDEHRKEEPDATTTVHYYWGSVGRPLYKLTKKTVKYRLYWDAHDAVMSRIKDKRLKGYHQVRNSLYFQAVEEFLDTIRKGDADDHE